MTRRNILFSALACGLAIAAVVVGLARDRILGRGASSAAAIAPAAAPPSGAHDEATDASSSAHQAFIHGRVTTLGGDTHEGRLRWGGTEEAFWGDHFNGFRTETPWSAFVPPERRPAPRRAFEILGIPVGPVKADAGAGRPFLARFGDISRIDLHGVHVRVTLKSGTTFDLDRFEAGDFDDGVRAWDARRGVVDIDSLRIRSIEFFGSVEPQPVPRRLHGTVRTPEGEFTGFVQWNRTECLGTDLLRGRGGEGEIALPFGDIRSIERRSPGSCLVTLLDGREIELTGKRDAMHGSRGISVDVPGRGRVLISWDVFERLDFSDGAIGPAYEDFPAGRPLSGSVTTRDGRRLGGRLVFDLDESETTETLDAPRAGLDHAIPFGLIAAIVLPGKDAPDAAHARVTLSDGAELQLELSGDLGDRNGGLLVFGDAGEKPEHVPWIDVERIDLEPPS